MGSCYQMKSNDEESKGKVRVVVRQVKHAVSVTRTILRHLVPPYPVGRSVGQSARIKKNLKFGQAFPKTL
jgi:hypothetical protein